MQGYFCEVCQRKTLFKRIEQPVKKEIRGTMLQVNHEYDQCMNCYTLYEPLGNEHKNILNTYAVYREKIGYLQPEEIRQIRERYQLSVRGFALMLGLSYQNVARIEAGALQNGYENMLFKCAASPKLMYKWMMRKKEMLPVLDRSKGPGSSEVYLG